MPSDAEDDSDSPGAVSENDSDGMPEQASARVTKDGKAGASKEASKAGSKSNAKDPNRPRRKKARRACHACQRAHLTCGDERPCNRCVKRGLAEACADGMRKKAKYLHDAPNEALVAPYPGQYHLNGSHPMQTLPGAPQIANHVVPPQPGHYYPQPAAGTYSQFSPVSHQGPMGPLTSNIVGDYPPPQPGVEQHAQFPSNPSQQVSPISEMAASMNPSSAVGRVAHPSFDNLFPFNNDPDLFPFNLQGTDFGNQYGALEWGVLGHLTSGAVTAADVDPIASMGQPLDESPNFPSSFDYEPLQPWQNVLTSGARQGSSTYLWGLNNQHNGLDALGVREVITLYTESEDLLTLPFLSSTSSITGASDAKSPEFSTNYSSNTVSPDLSFTQADRSQQQGAQRQSLSQPRQQKQKATSFPKDPKLGSTNKRRRDTSEIYASVRAPYPYTQGFHNLTAYLNKHFHSKNVLRIAKALGAIRPSFISCNQNLNEDDLIFMEKSFRRTMYEYEGFMEYYGTPTVLCRRTGEVAYANKEFTLLTGWRLDVLTGDEPNLNVNTVSGGSGTQTGSTSKGAATPAAPANVDPTPGRPKSVLMPEILDEDSTVQFYEDFAELAFGASRSSIIGSQCYLLKYKTKDDPGWSSEGPSEKDKSRRANKQSEDQSESLIKGEAGVMGFGETDGKVRAVLSWTVKRDLFDIPMLIILNFLPIIPDLRTTT